MIIRALTRRLFIPSTRRYLEFYQNRMAEQSKDKINLMKSAVIEATKEEMSKKENRDCLAELKQIKSSPIKVVGICGSLRKSSFHMGMLRYLAGQKLEGVEFEIVSIADLPMFNQDLENIKEESKNPQAVQDFKAKIRAADAYFFSSPEYNFGVTAPFKNALDWGSRGQHGNEWKGKCATIVGAGGPGMTHKAQFQFRQICVFLQLKLIDLPQVGISAFAKEEDGNIPFDFANGDLLSKKWKGRLVTQMDILRDMTKKSKMAE